MRDVYVISDNIYSPLGNTTAQNFEHAEKNLTAIKKHEHTSISEKPFYAALFDNLAIDNEFTKFEQLLKNSIKESLKNISVDLKSNRLLLIISSTKGNISLLESGEVSKVLKERISLSASASVLQRTFGFVHAPIVISNACISGLISMITARRLLLADKYDTIIVSGADVISKFILSGFQSFHAVSDGFCKPFDVNRDGINLGEAGATIVLSIHKPTSQQEIIRFTGGSVSNDANHISGPSRTGAELAQAIKYAIDEAGIKKEKIDFISAHGTATVYNDDMESKAIALNGLQKVPVNSLKGYFGHTLGAAGILETVISLQSLRKATILPTKGCEEPGTAEMINVCRKLIKKDIDVCLKTASGFGGCNAAIVLDKE